MNSSVSSLEIRVNHVCLKVTDGLQLKTIQMKAEADGISVNQFCKALSQETREYYRQKLFPTKFGPEKAYRDEKGSWKMLDFEEDSQPYSLKRVLEANLYVHTRAYLMGLIMSEEGKRRKGWEPETVILRDDDKVATVKRGKLTLHFSDDWFGTLGKKGKRARDVEKRQIRDIAVAFASKEKVEVRSNTRKVRKTRRYKTKHSSEIRKVLS